MFFFFYSAPYMQPTWSGCSNLSYSWILSCVNLDASVSTIYYLTTLHKESCGASKDDDWLCINSAMLRGMRHLPKRYKAISLFYPLLGKRFCISLVRVGSHPNTIMNLVWNYHRQEDTDFGRLNGVSKSIMTMQTKGNRQGDDSCQVFS